YTTLTRTVPCSGPACRPAASGAAAFAGEGAPTRRLTTSVSITGLGALRERIDEAGGNAVKDRAHHHFERPVGKGVFHGVEHLACVGRQLLKAPGAGQRREWPVDQMEG